MDPADPADLDEFLIITYTKAAASELRGKIAAKLTERIAQDPGNRHLQKQMQRLYLTKISTVHGFCSDVLREYAYKLDLPADFRVADETECREIREQVLTDLLDSVYQNIGEDPDILAFIDTQGLARELHETFYKGWYDIALPHKFKIGIGGCPNNCVKPGLNDFGIMGWKGGYRIFVGGIWGKKQRPGTLIDRVFTKDEVFEMLERCLLLFMELADGKERFGAMIDRIGVENFLAQLEAGDVMDRKSQILAR